MTAVESSPQKCPVKTFDYTETKPAGTWMRTYDELRAESPWYRNEFGLGFWMMLNYQGILQIMQDADTFSNSSVTAIDPNPPFKWIPEMLDGSEHRQWRHQLGPLFAPGAVDRLTPKIHQRAVELIEPLVAQGHCDLMADFAQKFPTTIFLELMGLPVEELDQFMAWEHAILHAGSGDEQAQQAQIEAMMTVMGRFATLIAERREDPRDDIISKAIHYTIDDEPVSDADLLSFSLLMFMAGLDTVSVSLGWSFLHLASNPQDRARIVAEPGMIPTAIEEFLRAYAIVVPSRKVTRDVVVQGCPMKAGDMVLIPINAATRDDVAFPDGQSVDITRKPNNHIGFGAGPHRCLGSHLARREMKVAMEEWHCRVPEYRLAEDSQMMEAGGQLGLNALPLVWER